MNLLTLSVLISWCLIKNAATFNLSPTPHRKLVEPNLPFYPRKVCSSYFGYQINLRKNYVIVSAPKGQTPFWTHHAFNETGSLYKCDLNVGQCQIWNVDKYSGNDEENGYTHSKSKQWFGAAMDSAGSSDDDLLTVCAPNTISIRTYYGETKYAYHGKCFLIEDFGHERTRQFQPLTNEDFQFKEIKDHNGWLMVPFPFFVFGQMGTSVQMSKTSSEYIIIIGAPGVYTGSGSVIRWRSHTTKHAVNLINAFDRIDVSDSNNFASDSYFGFAVAIGNFLSLNRTTYAASAPRAGFVQIFAFQEKNRMMVNYNHQMRVGQKILSEQFGEYFGYALLADDFNNDKYTDLAIGAPMYTKNGIDDNGKVYVYNCKKLICHQGGALFSSDHDVSGRFGMAFGKIGDINRDGFNDLAVGAPYEGNGKVYIFLGGPNGLSTVPSQIILAPKNVQTFGLAFSKGVDIDNNAYNDLVIGAPESDAIFIYKSYPVVQIFTSISSKTDKVSITDRLTQFTVCASYYTPLLWFKSNISIIMTINLDPQLKRATFVHSSKRNETIEMTITKLHSENCKPYQIHLNHSAVVQLPIVLEAKSELKKDFRTFNEFCDDCVAVSPNDINIVQSKIAIRSGCRDDQWCMADLTVTSNLTETNLTYTLGKPELITIKYEILNWGETAYFPKISVRLTPPTRFAKISPNCYVNGTIMYCYLRNSIPLNSNSSANCFVTINPMDLVGDRLTIEAVVSTSSNETYPSDNVLVNTINLNEFNMIEIIGKSDPPQISIFTDEDTDQINIIQEFTIINYGYSTMNEILFIAHIPRIYNNKFLITDHVEISTDREELDFDNDMMTRNSDHRYTTGYRKKRDTLGSIIADAFENHFVHIPHHRSRYFNCSVTHQMHACNTTILRLTNFVAKEKIKVILNITLNLKHLTDIVNKTHNILLFETMPALEKINDPHMKTYEITVMNTITIIELITGGKTPIIWIIVSIIVGILVLCCIIYWLHRKGFFRRKLHRQIKQIKNETVQHVGRESVQFTEIEQNEDD